MWNFCRLTLQKVSGLVDPISRVLRVVLLIPDERALDVRLWWHRSEAQAGVVADDAVLQLILRAAVNQRRREYEPHRHEER